MLMDDLTPTKGKIILLADSPEEQTASGIFIHNNVKVMPNTGTIKAVSNDSKFKIGQRVVFPRYSALQLKQNGSEELLALEEDLIIAVIGANQ